MFYLIKDSQLKEWGDYKFNEACLELLDVTMEEYNLHPNKYIVEGDILVPNPNYEKEEEEKEKERILSLSMTRSDFFDGTIKAFGADSDDLLISIQIVLRTLEIPEVDKKVAINNYKNALNFYRKHPLFTLLSNTPIPLDEEHTIIIITEAQWDRFFDETDKKNPNAYKELLS